VWIKKLRRLFAVFFFYLSLFIVVFHQVVFGGMSFVRRDIQRYYYPVWDFVHRSLSHGLLPFWNPYSDFGAPLLANPQACVFYPFTLIFYFTDFTWGFNFYILLHLALASFFTFLWMKDNGVSESAALISGVAYGFNGYLLSAINLTISLCSVAYFPLVLLCYRRAVSHKGYLWKGTTSLALLLQYLAGDPTVFFTTIFVLLIFTFYKTAECFISRSGRPTATFFDLIKIVGVFFGLAAFQLFLFLEFLLHSVRTHVPFSEAMMWSVRFSDLPGIFVPFFTDFNMFFLNYQLRQSWLESYYSGASVLTLALIGVFLRRKYDARPLYHVLLALLGIALCLGRYSLVYPLLHWGVPFFKFVRYPVRFFFLFSFAAACLAGFGVDRACEQTTRVFHQSQRAIREAVILTLLAVIVIGFAFFLTPIIRKAESLAPTLINHLADFFFDKAHQTPRSVTPFYEFIDQFLFNLKRSLFFLALVLLGAYAALHLNVRRRIMVLFFAALVFSDLAMCSETEPLVRAAHFRKPPAVVEVLTKDQSLFRLLASPLTSEHQTYPTSLQTEAIHSELKSLLAPNLHLLYGIQVIFGYDSIYLNNESGIANALMKLKLPVAKKKSANDMSPKLLDWLNVKYALSPKPALWRGFKRIHEASYGNLFANETVMPRAFLVERAVVEQNREILLKKITASDFDPVKEIYLEENEAKVLSASVESRVGGREDVTIKDYSLNLVKMQASVSRKPWLFFSDAYYPGWQAWVDGKLTTIYEANNAFRAIYLEPGSHEIVWKYDPPLFKLGLLITFLTCAGLLLYYLKIVFWQPLL